MTHARGATRGPRQAAQELALIVLGDRVEELDRDRPSQAPGALEHAAVDVTERAATDRLDEGEHATVAQREGVGGERMDTAHPVTMHLQRPHHRDSAGIGAICRGKIRAGRIGRDEEPRSWIEGDPSASLAHMREPITRTLANGQVSRRGGGGARRGARDARGRLGDRDLAGEAEPHGDLDHGAASAWTDCRTVSTPCTCATPAVGAPSVTPGGSGTFVSTSIDPSST